MNPLKQMATGAADLVIVDTFEPHPITRDLRIVTLFPATRTVGVAAKLPTGVTGQRLGMTSRDSFAETDLAALRRGEARPDTVIPGAAAGGRGGDQGQGAHRRLRDVAAGG